MVTRTNILIAGALGLIVASGIFILRANNPSSPSPQNNSKKASGPKSASMHSAPTRPNASRSRFAQSPHLNSSINSVVSQTIQPHTDNQTRVQPSQSPRNISPEKFQDDWSDSFLDTYKNWNSSWVKTNMNETANPVVLEEIVDWFHGKLGNCNEPTPIAHRGDSYARFKYPCANGELEVGFVSDEENSGKIRRLLLGARNIEPTIATRQASEKALRLIDTWSIERFKNIFSDNFDAKKMEVFFSDVQKERGSCIIESPDLVNARGAIWSIACDNGPGMMKVDLDDNDRINLFFINDRKSDHP